MYDARLTVKTYWGLDIGFRRVSIASVTSDGRWRVETATVPTGISDGETVKMLRRCALNCAEALMDLGSPEAIVVEQPSGKYVSYQMHYSAAITLEAMASLECGYVDMLPPGTWKKTTLGAGNGGAGKPQIMEWAREFGYDGDSQDEADAIGIAVACRELTTVG